MKKFLIVMFGIFLLCGCSDKESDKVNYMEAKEKIINEQAVLLDVRTEEEFSAKHIDGAISLPLDEINEDSLANIFSSKNSVIIVYCQSGNRSSQALSIIKDYGYDKVYDLGGIGNWKE